MLLSLILIGAVEPVFAQANFYEGKTIRFIVGFSAGGGYDTYTRMIARHMGKYVPGNPVLRRRQYGWGGEHDLSQLRLQGRQA